MTIHLPEDLASSIRAEVRNGHFASEGEAVAAAVRDFLQRKHAQVEQTGKAAAGGLPTPTEEPSAEELQRRLFESGVIRETRAPITDLAPYRNRQAVPIQGEPLSETVVRERR